MWQSQQTSSPSTQLNKLSFASSLTIYNLLLNINTELSKGHNDALGGSETDKTLPLKDTFWTLLLDVPRMCQEQEVKAITPILEFLLFFERQMLVCP